MHSLVGLPRLGYPVLRLIIDGHSAYVAEPKQTLLDAGLVVLLDEAGYWETTLSADYHPPDKSPAVCVRGASNDAQLVALVRRFVNGETGNLLNE